MKVKFIGKSGMRIGRTDYKPGETYTVPDCLELPELYFEQLDKKVEPVKTKQKTKKSVSKKKSSKKSD